MIRLLRRLLPLVGVSLVGLSVSTVADARIEILPTPSEAVPVTFEFKSIGKQTLETTGRKKVTCTSVSGDGSATSEQLGKIEFKYVGCVGPLFVKCTGLADTVAGNITFQDGWRLRHLLPTTAGIALVLKLELMHFSCSGILFAVSGCTASKDLLTESGGHSIGELLVLSVYVDFGQASGKQEPPEIDNELGTGMEDCVATTREEMKAPEESGLGQEFTINAFTQKGKLVILLVHLT